jgi:adenine specific DNA methylase Mod
MAKQYKGSLSLDWYNKQKAILLRSEEQTKTVNDIPAPKINWVNKDESLFYEINEKEGKGVAPYWVDKGDIRIKEARPLDFKKGFVAAPKDKAGSLPGLVTEYKIDEISSDDKTIENLLIKGDNLLALNTIKKIFDNKPEEEKIKCIYIDPPYNTGSAFDHYDDNLAHSEWLTLLRDRLILLKELLRNDGMIFIQIDDEELGYLLTLCNEIFGRNNFIKSIAVKMSTASGVKTSHREKTIIKEKENIIVYAKNKDAFVINPQYVPKLTWDDEFHNYLEKNNSNNPDDWEVIKLAIVLEKNKIKNNPTDAAFQEFVKENADKIWRRAFIRGDAKELSQKNPTKIYVYGENDETHYIYKGREMYFYSKTLHDCFTESGIINTPSTLLGDFWTDINTGKLFNEGNNEFRNGKKPEFLVARILQMATNENDWVLDCFGGSGTTFAVAHKMKRRWIGIEVGNHIESHIIKRLKDVLVNSDTSGITAAVNWQGGGSFKYYHLGESIIKLNEDGTGDFNWSLGKEFIQESFLSSYDYILDNSINFQEGELFTDKKNQPVVGIQTIGTKKRVAVITLNEPKGKLVTLSYEEMQSIYKTIKKKYSPEYINIFTNRGVEIAYDSKPDDLEVVKIPNAIFAELEK